MCAHLYFMYNILSQLFIFSRSEFNIYVLPTYRIEVLTVYFVQMLIINRNQCSKHIYKQIRMYLIMCRQKLIQQIFLNLKFYISANNLNCSVLVDVFDFINDNYITFNFLFRLQSHLKC